LSLALVFSLFTVSLPQIGYAQGAAQTQVTTDLQKSLQTIEEKVEKRRAELGIPGMSLAIVKDGQVIYAKGLGYKDFEKKIPATADTQFAIGSATKAFTALSILMSQDEGKLSLDDSPKKYLPYFKMKDADTDKNMTVRDLMAHTSGLNRTDLAMITGQLNRQELIRVAGEAQPMAKLREKFFYQNIMFAAAGEVVASVQKTTWEKFVPKRIFKPLGMTNSTMDMKQMQKAKDYSFGYQYNFDTKETRKLPFRDIDEVAPAGSINSSARDMAKWITFVMNGGVVDGKRLVSEKGFEEWTKPQMKITPDGKVSYGLGWFLREWKGLKVVEHGGNIDGFNALVAMIPEKKLGFVMLTNVSGSPLGSELMPIVWENILGNPETAENDKKTEQKTTKNETVKELIGKYSPNGQVFAEIKSETDGKVTFNIESQPPFTLVEKSKDNYSLAPLPASYSLKVKRDADGKVQSVVIVQPEGEFEFKKTDGKADDKPKITADELMAKAIEAAGGEANWRKIASRVTESDFDMIHQGVKGFSTTYAKIPNKTATENTMTTLGKTIAKGWEFFDGTQGEEIYTFAPVEKYSGKKLEDIRLGADFYALLNWKKNYKTVEIKGTEKVGDEDCYVVEFTPEKGTKVTELYSTTSFLLLKRRGVVPSSTRGQNLPYTITFSDYREVDGIKLSFKMISSNPGMGDTVVTVKSVKHNVAVDDKIFAPRELKLN
jgi:CubicO group peptidase (beta-lactamase class C family)